MSVFCRYENALLVPAFVGYEFLFDKEGRSSSKLTYGLLCAGSSLYILFCNYHVFGNPFFMIQTQTLAALHNPHSLPVSMTEAFKIVGRLLSNLFSPWLWGAALAGIAVMIARYRLKALWLFLGVLPLELFLIYKIKTATLDIFEEYFFLLALIALPVGLEFVRTVFIKSGFRQSSGILALGVVAFCSIVSFHQVNVLRADSQSSYAPELSRLLETLKHIPATSALYIDDDFTLPGFSTNMILASLSRNPEKFRYYSGKPAPQKYRNAPEKTEPPEMEYYLLTVKDKTGKMPGREEDIVWDYGVCGFDDFALYHITRSENKK